MKVLIVSPVPTDPLVAGNRARVAALFAALTRLGHDVAFAYVPYELADYDRMKIRLGARLHVLRATPPPFQSVSARVLRKIKHTLSLESAHLWRVDQWFDDGLVPQIRQLQAEQSFDSVLIEYVFLSKLASILPNSVRTIIDTHDLMGNRHKRYLNAGMRPQWFSTTPAEEISALNRAKAIIAIQQGEADYLKRNVPVEVFCVGHLFDLDFAPLPDPVGARILLVGSANPINVQGLEWFLDLVFPKIRRRIPDSELVLAGEVGRGRNWPDGVSVLGNLDSLADIYACATVVINPVKFGTGLPVKTVEALSYGKPVVATSAGGRGLEVDFNGAVFLCDDPDTFAERVLELLENKHTRSTMSQHAISVAGEWQRRQLAMLHRAVAGDSRWANRPAITQNADYPLRLGA